MVSTSRQHSVNMNSSQQLALPQQALTQNSIKCDPTVAPFDPRMMILAPTQELGITDLFLFTSVVLQSQVTNITCLDSVLALSRSFLSL